MWVGSIALASLLADEARSESIDPLAPKPPHSAASEASDLSVHAAACRTWTLSIRSRNSGTQRQAAANSKPQFEFGGTGNLSLPWKFKVRPGGIEVSDLFHRSADDRRHLVIRSMTGERSLHGPACLRLNTGDGVSNRRSQAWTLYGWEQRIATCLDSCRSALLCITAAQLQVRIPANVLSGNTGRRWQHRLQEGVLANTTPAADLDLQRLQLDLLAHRIRNTSHAQVPIAGSKQNRDAFELAFRMQASAPHVFEANVHSSVNYSYPRNYWDITATKNNHDERTEGRPADRRPVAGR